MATTLEELRVLISAETKGLRKELDAVKTQLGSTHREVSKATSGITNAFKSMVPLIGLTLMIRKMVQFGQASIGLASNLSEVQNVVDVTFGDMAVEINTWSKNALERFGLAELSAKRYSSTLGAMMKSSGLAGSQMKDMSMKLTELSADMASFYNLSGDEAFDKIRSGLSGETEPLKRLGINMSVANLEAYALSQGIRKSYNAMSQAEQTLLRYNYLLSVTKDAQGDFARTSGSWANQVRLLSEQWKVFQSTIGQGLISVLTPVVKWLNAIIQKLQIVAQYFRAFVTAMTGANAGQEKAANAAAEAQLGVAAAVTEAGKAAKGATAGFDVFNDISKQGAGEAEAISMPGPFAELAMPDIALDGEDPITGKVQSMVNNVKAAWATGVASIKGIGASLKEAFTAPIKSALDRVKPELSAFKDSVVGSFGKIAELGEPLRNWFTGHLVPYWQDGIEATGVQLAGWLDSLRMVFDGVFNAAYPVLEWFVVSGLPLLTSFADSGLTVLMSLWSGAKDIFDTLWSGAIQPGLELVSKIIVDTLDVIRERWYEFGDRIVGKILESHEKLRALWSAFWEGFLQPIINTIIQTVTWLWDEHLKYLVDQLLVFIGKLVEGAMDIYNKFILPIATWLTTIFGPTFASGFQLVIQVAGTLIAFVADMAKSILKFLGGIIDFLVGVFTLDWKRAWQGVKDIFGGIWDGITGTVKGAINIIVDLVNWMIRGLNRISFEVPAWVPFVGGKSWGISIPEIPKLANGGLAYGATLAMVGDNFSAGTDPEVISPLSMLKNIILEALMQREIATGGGRELRLTLLLDTGEVFADMLIDPLNNKAKNLGYAPVFKPAT